MRQVEIEVEVIGQFTTGSHQVASMQQSTNPKRRTASIGDSFTLDGGDVVIEFVGVAGSGVSTSNENDRSVVAVVRYGAFDAVIGGDLSGYDHDNYHDIETVVADVTPKSWTVTTLRSCGSAAPFSEPAEGCFVVQRRVSPLLVEVA